MFWMIRIEGEERERRGRGEGEEREKRGRGERKGED